MSTVAAVTPDGAVSDDPRRRFPTPPMGRLVLVELRKMVNTRSGRWLLIASVLIALLVAVIRALAGTMEDRTFAHMFELTLIPFGVLLPVIGILTATSEWSQRTALTTFALVPRRQRIGLAKILAGILLGVLAVLASLLVAAIGNVVGILAGGIDGTWSLSASGFLQAWLFIELSLLWGIGFGLLLMSPAVAIVAYFALPTAFSIVGEVFSSLQSTWEWLDPSQSMQGLTDGSAAGGDWGKIAVSSALWILLPLVLGLIRMTRREIK